jgi:hypothetical protein
MARLDNSWTSARASASFRLSPASRYWSVSISASAIGPLGISSMETAMGNGGPH